MAARPDRDTLHLSLILSGAVALGAYEGGVVAQIAYALAARCREEPDRPPPFVIDVVAGASAGAMTGAMLAHHLMHGSDPRRFVENTRLSWCGDRTTLRRMARVDPARDAHSVLSSASIDELAAGFFGEQVVDRDAVFQDELVFTCTLTPLEPLAYEFQVLTDLPYRRRTMTGWSCRDWAIFSVTPDAHRPVQELPTRHRRRDVREPSEVVGSWRRLIRAAVASGAFPAAFQPMEISRPRWHYPEPLRADADEENPWLRLRYVDGGVLDNMPFQLASQALSSLERHDPLDRRWYLLVEVNPFQAQLHRYRFQPGEVDAARDPSTTLPQVLGGCFSAMREQALYRDLMKSQEINRNLYWRDRFLLPALRELVTGSAGPAAAAAAARERLAEQLAQRWSPARETVDDVLAEYRRRASDDRSPLHLLALQLTEAQLELLLLHAALADLATGLAGKVPVAVQTIAPAGSCVLAGEHLGAFGGFLHPDLSHHDFLQGLRDGYRWLRNTGVLGADPAPVDWYCTAPLGEYLADRGLEDVPKHLLEEASDLGLERTFDLVRTDVPALRFLASGLPGWLFRCLLDSSLRFSQNPETVHLPPRRPFRPQDE